MGRFYGANLVHSVPEAVVAKKNAPIRGVMVCGRLLQTGSEIVALNMGE